MYVMIYYHYIVWKGNEKDGFNVQNLKEFDGWVVCERESCCFSLEESDAFKGKLGYNPWKP